MTRLIPQALAAICLLYLLATKTLAENTGLTTADTTSFEGAAAGLRTCRVSAVFDNPDDVLLQVGFAEIVTDAPEGFYQNALGGDLPPDPMLCTTDILVCSDSYVTIGTSESFTCPDFCPPCFNPPLPQHLLVGDWAALPPFTGSHPDENLQVMLAQLTVPLGSVIQGTLTTFINDGQVGYSGNFTCDFSSCVGELTGDGKVNGYDMASLLGHWGPNSRHAADLNYEGVVGPADLALLLANWTGTDVCE